MSRESRSSRKAQRRASRKAEARKQEQRKQMLRWGGVSIVVAIVAVVALVFVNQGDDLPDAIEWDTVAAEGRYLGEPDAPIDFVVYTDFQCPFCKMFDEQDFPPIVENFVKSGDVRVEWRPLPIIASAQNIPMDSPQNESMRSSEAAMCAADQNQFWPYSTALYDAQGSENSGVYNDTMLIDTARDLDMDVAAFESCLITNEKQDEVLEFHQDAFGRGVMATPTFLINDTPVRYSAEGYSRLEQQINDALRREELSDQ